MSKFSPLQLWHYKANGHITGRATQVPKVFQTKCQSNIELLGQAITICHRENFVCLKIAPKQGCSVGWRESAGCWVQTCAPRKKGSFCEAAILIATWQSIQQTILIWFMMCSCWWYIYIYISFVFAVAAAGCLGETKYAKRSEETEWILGALIPIQSYMLLKIKHDFWNDFRWIVYNQQETNSPIVLTSVFLSYMFLPFNSPSVIQERW